MKTLESYLNYQILRYLIFDLANFNLIVGALNCCMNMVGPIGEKLWVIWSIRLCTFFLHCTLFGTIKSTKRKHVGQFLSCLVNTEWPLHHKMPIHRYSCWCMYLLFWIDRSHSWMQIKMTRVHFLIIHISKKFIKWTSYYNSLTP